jgi:hypothetical protein
VAAGDLKFKPGDLVTTYAPGRAVTYVDARQGMILMKNYGPNDDATRQMFNVSWNAVGIVLASGCYPCAPSDAGYDRVLVMFGDRVGWNNENCFKHVQEAIASGMIEG